MEQRCRHSKDNNRIALLGVLGTSLILALAGLGMACYVVFAASVEGSAASIGIGSVLPLLLITKIVGCSLGLIGTEKQKQKMLLGSFICDILFAVGTVVYVIVISLLVSFTAWSVVTSAAGAVLLFFHTSLMVLCFQTRLQLRDTNEAWATCSHTIDNNRTALLWMLPIALVLSCAIAVVSIIAMSQGGAFLGFMMTLIPNIVSIVAFIVGIIAIASSVLPNTKMNMLLATFIMEVLAVAAVYTGSFLTSEPFTIVFAIVTRGVFLLTGPSLVMSWQSRSSLQDKGHYEPLAGVS